MEGYKITFHPPDAWDEGTKCDNCDNDLHETGAWEFPGEEGHRYGPDEGGTGYYCPECAKVKFEISVESLCDEIRESGLDPYWSSF